MAKTDIFTRARANLVLSQPFFGALALRMKVIETTDCETAETDGCSIRYNPEFVNALPLAKVTGLVAHEVMHSALLHTTRRGSRDHRKWNIACDYAINNILVESGFDLPDGGCIDAQYNGMGAEEIYSKLPDPPEGSGRDPGGNGGVTEPPGSGPSGKPSQGELDSHEADWKVALAQAAHIAKQMGKLPSGLSRLIDDALEPQTNWRAELIQFCNTPKPSDVTWNRPNRRFISAGMYLPSRDVKMSGTFVTVIDTSGSIGEKELNEFGAEIRGIVDQLKPDKTYVMYCDAAVAHVDEFLPGEELTFAAHGGGGTDFRPPFDWLKDRDITPDALVYLTDGYGEFPEGDDVHFPTLWAINNRSVVPPFGVHIVLEV